MKILILTCIAAIGFQVQAQVPAHHVSTHHQFTIRSTNATGTNYYSCDTVKDATTDLLSKLGASAISVRCTGGIQYGQPAMDAFVDVIFDSLKLADINDTNIVMANWMPVKLHSWNDCELKSQILKNTQSGFSITNAKVFSCSSSTSQFGASLITLF